MGLAQQASKSLQGRSTPRIRESTQRESPGLRSVECKYEKTRHHLSTVYVSVETAHQAAHWQDRKVVAIPLRSMEIWRPMRLDCRLTEPIPRRLAEGARYVYDPLRSWSRRLCRRWPLYPASHRQSSGSPLSRPMADHPGRSHLDLFLLRCCAACQYCRPSLNTRRGLTLGSSCDRIVCLGLECIRCWPGRTWCIWAARRRLWMISLGISLVVSAA